MMIVESVERGTHEGTEVYVYTGAVYVLRGDGAWPQSAFLGDIRLELAGAGRWMSPLDGIFVIGCSLDEAEDPIDF